MKALSILLLFAAYILLSSCQNTGVEAKEDYLGEWRYVGTFDHRANYACYICPGFDFDQSIYRIRFNADNTFGTEINLMRGEGKYDFTPRELNRGDLIYDFDIKDYKELNKPLETEADGMFRKALLASYLVSVQSSTNKYKQLQMLFNENEFMLFVQEL